MVRWIDCKSSGVSTILGFVLILSIIISFITFLQAYAVPQWNKAVEFQHLTELSYKVSEINELICSAMVRGESERLTLKGVQYPNYPFLVSPLQSSLTINFKKLNVTINGVNYTTYAIIVVPNYLYLQRPTLIYEYSAVFEEYSNKNLIVKSDQTAFSPKKLTLYLINTSLSTISFTGYIDLIFKPISYGGSLHYNDVTITFESYDNKTAEWWNETLNDIGFKATRSGNKVTVKAKDIDVSLIEIIVYSKSTEVKENVSLSPLKLINLSKEKYDVYVGTTIELKVKVVDRLGNPVAGKNVSIDVNPNTPSNPDLTEISDDNGEVTYLFNAESPGTYNVTFSIPEDKFTYHIYVRPRNGSGIFNIYWIEGASYEWNVTKEGYSKIFEVKVTYNGNDVIDAKVNFFTDKPWVDISERYGYTDSNGIAKVKVTAFDNGVVNLFAMCGGAVAVLELHITGVTLYCREITIQNRVDYELTDYQVKIELDSSNFDFSHAKSDGSDIRFYDPETEKKLSYWIEVWDKGSEHAIIWVKIPSIPANGVKKIRMVYGNPNASGESDGSATFDFFDDFTTWNGWINWGSGRVEQSTYDGRCVLKKCDYCDPNGGWKSIGKTINNFRLLVKEIRVKAGWYCPCDRYGLENSNFNGYGIFRVAYTWGWGDFGWEIRKEGMSKYLYIRKAYQPYNKWYITELIRYEKKIIARLYNEKGELIREVTGNIPSSYMYYNLDRVVIRGGTPYYIDWIAVAKYVDPEPLVTIGEEETYPS